MKAIFIIVYQMFSERSMDELQLKELQDQLEAEQYFSSLYKTQVKELKEEIEEKQRIISDFEEEKYKKHINYIEMIANFQMICLIGVVFVIKSRSRWPGLKRKVWRADRLRS